MQKTKTHVSTTAHRIQIHRGAGRRLQRLRSSPSSPGPIHGSERFVDQVLAPRNCIRQHRPGITGDGQTTAATGGTTKVVDLSATQNIERLCVRCLDVLGACAPTIGVPQMWGWCQGRAVGGVIVVVLDFE